MNPAILGCPLSPAANCLGSELYSLPTPCECIVRQRDFHEQATCRNNRAIHPAQIQLPQLRFGLSQRGLFMR
jgi:hypothetical protein